MGWEKYKSRTDLAEGLNTKTIRLWKNKYTKGGSEVTPSEDDIKQYLLENVSEEMFKELSEEEENAE